MEKLEELGPFVESLLALRRTSYLRFEKERRALDYFRQQHKKKSF